MSEVEFFKLLPVFNSVSIVALCLFFVFAFMTRRVVPGSEVDYERKEKAEAQRQRDEYKAIADRGTGQSAQLVDMMRLMVEMRKDQ